MKRTLSIITLLLIAMLALSACQPAAPPAPPQNQGDQGQGDAPQWKVTFVKQDGSTVELTDKNVGELELVEIEAVKQRKDGSEETQQWKGYRLQDVLEQLELTEFASLAPEAADGYTSELSKEAAADEGTILGLELNGEPLEESSGPVQLVVASERSNSWIKQLSKITLK